MKRIRNFICILLACGLLASLFMGCDSSRELLPGDTKTTTASTAGTTAQTTAQESTTAEEQGVAAYITNNPIDKEYDEAIKNIRNSTKHEITQDYAQRWKKEMETNLQKLNAKLSEEHQKLLSAAQKDWEAYIKDELKFGYAYAEILGLNGDEALAHNAKCYYNAYRDRAVALYEYLQAITEKYGDVPYFETEE